MAPPNAWRPAWAWEPSDSMEGMIDLFNACLLKQARRACQHLERVMDGDRFVCFAAYRMMTQFFVT